MRPSLIPSNHDPGPSIQWSFLENCSRDHIYLSGLELCFPGGAFMISPFLWKESMKSLHPWDSTSQWTSTRLPVLLDVAKGWGLFSPLWEKETGRYEGALPASLGMAIIPFTTSDTPAPPACNLLPLWPSLFLWESPSWHMAGFQAQPVLVNQHV